MKILAFDTSASACSVAILHNDAITLSHKIAPAMQAQLILPMINELLEETSIKLTELDAIAFGQGPGSFTGVRIATSVAQGLGFACQLPLIPVSSLAAIAQHYGETNDWQRIAVAIDARMEQVYGGFYHRNANNCVELAESEVLCFPHEFILPKQDEWMCVGNAWEIYSGKMPASTTIIKDSTESIPKASAIASLAKQEFLNNKVFHPRDVHPVYLRDNVATKSTK